MYKKGGTQSDERRTQISIFDRCCSSSGHDHADFRVRKAITPDSLEAFWDLRQNFLCSCFYSFFWLGSLWMAPRTHYGARLRKFPQKLFGGDLFPLGRLGEFTLWRISCHPRSSSLNDVVDRIYINDLPFDAPRGL